MNHSPQAVLEFWFEQASPKLWWQKSAVFDQHVRQRFLDLLEAASACELDSWRDSPLGRLAEIIVLDQFSRNIHRDMPPAFTQDPLALALAQEAVRFGALQQLDDKNHRAFLLMPYMHSESRQIHEQAEKLFEQYAPDNLDFELRHKAIIDRFGRYPHRNVTLGRQSTPDELAFLQQPGSAF